MQLAQALIFSGKQLLKRLPIICCLGIALGFYLWTASSSGRGFYFDSHDMNYYNLLADGFTDGHLYLPLTPEKKLLALPNPYDPVANAPYRLHDASLYKGHWYLYFGPTPALTLFVPAQLVGLRVPDNLAVVIYGCIGLLFAVLLLQWLVKRYLPKTPIWLQSTAVLGLAFSNVLPFILRRTAAYEVAISAGYCFTMAGLYFLISGGLGERISKKRLLLGSLCLGFAMGARVNLGLTLLAAAALLICLIRRDTALGLKKKAVLAVYILGPAAISLLLLLLYNKLRFDSFTEFGSNYQLAGYDVTKKDFFNLAYMVPGFYLYFLARPMFDIDFPFIHLPTHPHFPGAFPPGYDGIEPTAGLLLSTPIIVLILLILPLLLWQRRNPELRAPLVVATGFASLGLLITAIISFTIFGTTMRYEVDFASLFLIAAFLCWFTLVRILKSRPIIRVGLNALLSALTAFGIVVGVALSLTGYYNNLLAAEPETFRNLRNSFSWVPTLVAKIEGSRPLIAGVENPDGLERKERGSDTAITSTAFLMYRGNTVIMIVSPGDQSVQITGLFKRSSPPAPNTTPLIVSLRTPGGKPMRQELASGAATEMNFDVKLHSGLNYLMLRVDGGLLPQQTTPPTPPQIAVTHVANLRLNFDRDINPR